LFGGFVSTVTFLASSSDVSQMWNTIKSTSKMFLASFGLFKEKTASICTSRMKQDDRDKQDVKRNIDLNSNGK
ncbi:hypothetical protein GOODEAATRI_031494, partial [Goodea atripinnis]